MLQPTQFGQRLNVWAMIKNLVAQNIGFFTTTESPDSTTLVGLAGTGAFLIDTEDGSVYVNVGTIDAPVWQGLFLPATAGSGLGSTGSAKFSYDFAQDGGAIGTIVPASSPVVPEGAIPIFAVLDVTEAVTSGGAATIALGFGSTLQAASLKAAQPLAAFVVGTSDLAVTAFRVSPSEPMSLTVNAFALTGGKFSVNVSYFMGNP